VAARDRQNFTPEQRRSAFQANARWLSDHNVDGIWIAEGYEHLRRSGLICYCENCLFCHTDQSYFDVDHLVPDSQFKAWGKHVEARDSINMVILCKSIEKGSLGCNQCKNASLWVPRLRGLAFTRQVLDMNCYPLKDRPFRWVE
jgi:hypothetical protein